MTRIDKYLEKYLDGSITEKETEEFRELLASDPRLEQELAETLELRSVIHDDLLEIEPPAWLSSRVEAMVGERFAAIPFESDPYVEEDEEERRRGVVLPWFVSGRMAGSMAVAAVLLLMVALAPTVTFESGGPLGSGQPFAVGNGADVDRSDRPVASLLPQNTPAADAAGRNLEADSRSASADAAELIRAGRPVADPSAENSGGVTRATPPAEAPSLPEPDQSVAEDLLLAEETVESPTSAIDPADQAVAANTINELQWLLAAPNRLDYLTREDLTADDPDRELADRRIGRSVVPSLDDELGAHSASPRGLRLSRGNSEASADLAESRLPIDEKNENYQRVMFGGTLASGLTSRSTGVSIEGSAYLALGLGENSRIGLEGGSATFRHRRDVTVEILTPAGVESMAAARGVVQEDDEGGKGMMLIGAGGRAGGVGAGGESGGGGLNPGGESGSGVEDPTPTQIITFPDEPVPTRGRIEGYNVSYSRQSYEIDASMVYGLVFYDHTVTSLSDRLNLNGRVGIGGTDGGMVLSARAYAAIASHENIAWTLGVGGSMLHDFAGEIDFNATYGLNAGVEFGF